MDLEPCIADLPLSPLNPLHHSSFHHSSFSSSSQQQQQQQHGLAGVGGLHHGAHPAYLHHDGGAAFPLMSRCNSSTLLTNLGLMRYHGGPRQQQQGAPPPSQGALPPGGMMIDPSGGGGGCGGCSRPYRSMENLNWNNVQQQAAETQPGGGLYGYGVPYRSSVDSEFIFRCTTATSHWCGDGGDGAPDSGNKAGYYGGGAVMMPNPESLAFYPRGRRGTCLLPPRTDLPLFPQWHMFPAGGDMDEWEARKGLRDKLRLQSAARSSGTAAEPLKPQHPLRPSPTATVQVPPSCDRDVGGGPPPPPPHVPVVHCRPLQCSAGLRRITSPEDIKQEVLRRLQLRRQNSSPNLLALSQHHTHHSSSPERRPEEEGLLLKTSYTTDNIAGKRAAAMAPPQPEPRGRPPPTGRLHIPTFEEFKRMRQQECRSVGTTAASEEKAEEVQLSAAQPDDTETTAAPSGRADAPPPPSASDGERRERGGGGGERTGPRTGGEGRQYFSSETPPSSSPSPHCSTLLSPIRTGPAPRSPLQTEEAMATEKEEGEEEEERGGCVVEPRRSSLEPAAGISVPLLPHHHSDHSSGVSWERPASCCPALLLEGSELSRVGAKIYKMKDGLIGSALDLIKKSCSAESPADETPVRVSGDREGGGGGGGSDITTAPPTTHCQSSPVSMATAATACGATEEEEEEEEASDETPAGGEEPAECQHPGLGCRRSSSDAAYELARTARVSQRECRLRPHYSDPMPADAAKRKQLEMKIAAAARLHHSQRRDRERDRDSAPAAVRGRSEPRGSEDSRQGSDGGGGLGVGVAAVTTTRSGAGQQQQHRWSTVSSLSADSGVVGLSDEGREDQEDAEPRRNHHHTHHHHYHHQHRHRSTRGGGGGGGVDVERADSGIGGQGPGGGGGGGLNRGWKRPSASLRAWEAQRPCPDCGQRDLGGGGGGGGGSRELLRNGEGGVMSSMCERCSKLRTERKEAILEFLNTESSYGEDLRIIREEFYCPMQSAGLLTAEHLSVVFGNVQELIEVNERFSEHLQDSVDQAFDQGDEDLLTVYIGEIFLEFVNMLPAFQTYCLQQSTSVNMLNTLEKEKELLRIFLDASQNDNTALRRMNLRSFLMAPLQRVTKYPLLLSRISKATTECHPDHGRLREAKSRVESHLEHINMKTKQEGGGGGSVTVTGGGGGVTTWSLRSFRRDSRKNRSEVINIEMREVSMKTVGWARENTRFVMEGPLQLSQPADGQWVKKGSKALKFQNVQSLLMVRTQRGSGTGTGGGDQGGGPELLGNVNNGGTTTTASETVWDGVLVLIKDKSSGKFAVLREPIRLGNCVVSTEPDCEDTFEVLDIRRESFVFRAGDKSRTQQWFRQIKRYARDLGPWRKRRNALPNIMVNVTNQTRS